MRTLLLVFVVPFALGACGGPESPDPAASIVRVDAEPPGQHCAEGGSAVRVGLDDDGDGALDGDEIDSTTYVCEPDSLIRANDEPAGSNCAAGGTAIHSGPDRDGSGVLDDDEITATTYVCNDELPPLLTRFDHEPAGANCATGGTAVRAGLDRDGDGTLGEAEVLHVDYACDEARLVRVDEEASGPNCVGGGAAVRSGADIDEDGTLDDAEVTATEYICDRLIVGDLDIDSRDELAALADVEVITGNLSVSHASSITSIEFPALRLVGGDVSIESCHAMTHVSLPALATVIGTVRIDSNEALTSVTLPALRTAGSIWIYENYALAGLDLGTLEQVTGLEIRDNPILDLNLGALRSAANVSLRNLPATTIALPRLHHVENFLVSESALTSFSAPQLTFAVNDLTFAENSSLPSLLLPSVKVIGGRLVIRSQGAMTSFSLPELIAVGDELDTWDGPSLSVWNNPSLTSFSLPQLRTSNALWIADNDALVSLGGLAALETVDRFELDGNASLADLSDVTQLRQVGDFWIDRSALHRLGLPNLVAVSKLYVADLRRACPAQSGQRLATHGGRERRQRHLQWVTS